MQFETTRPASQEENAMNLPTKYDKSLGMKSTTFGYDSELLNCLCIAWRWPKVFACEMA